MKPVDAMGSIDVPSIPPIEGRPVSEGERAHPEVSPKSVDGDRGKVDRQNQAERELAKETADRLNRMSRLFDRKIQFEVPVDTRDVIVKIIDRETGKVIRQIPPPELVKLAKQMDAIYEFIFRSKV